jgi:hypothetical protein
VHKNDSYRGYQLFPAETYNVELYDAYFQMWLDLTKREYDPDHKIKFIIPKDVAADRLSPERLKLQHPELVLEPDERDVEYDGWHGDETTDLEGASKLLFSSSFLFELSVILFIQ